MSSRESLDFLDLFSSESRQLGKREPGTIFYVFSYVCLKMPQKVQITWICQKILSVAFD